MKRFNFQVFSSRWNNTGRRLDRLLGRRRQLLSTRKPEHAAAGKRSSKIIDAQKSTGAFSLWLITFTAFYQHFLNCFVLEIPPTAFPVCVPINYFFNTWKISSHNMTRPLNVRFLIMIIVLCHGLNKELNWTKHN